ncbi:hypothetical protein TrRE_jg7496 [Triparma retinervis]|uniref:Uncharacterized protein n=1 Tax=Triparma retinervis TaxID=2557542 RepID=A0A9W6ZJG9_9STRA|nr:hypothetical protein TrRE_jg7496 [Triparma retinervis]
MGELVWTESCEGKEIPISGEQVFFTSGLASDDPQVVTQSGKIAEWEDEIDSIIEEGVGDQTDGGIIVAAYIKLVTMLRIRCRLGYMWAKPNGTSDYHKPHQDSTSWFGLTGGIGGLDLPAKCIASIFLRPTTGISAPLTFSNSSGQNDQVYNLQKHHGAINCMDMVAGGVKQWGGKLFHGAGQSPHSHLTLVFVGTGGIFSSEEELKYEQSLQTVTKALLSRGIIGPHEEETEEKEWPHHDLPVLPQSVNTSMRGKAGGEAGQKTDKGQERGVHMKADGTLSTSTKGRGEAGGKASQKTDEGQEPGVHKKADGTLSMSRKERGEASNKTDEGQEPGVHKKADGTLSMSISNRGRVKWGGGKLGLTRVGTYASSDARKKAVLKNTNELRGRRKGYRWVCPNCSKSYSWRHRGNTHAKGKKTSRACKLAMETQKDSYVDPQGNPCDLP